MASSRSSATGIFWVALRPVLAWPLHSRRRFVAVITAALVVLWMTLTHTGGSGGPAAAAPSSAASTSVAPSTAAPSSSSDGSSPATTLSSSTSPTWTGSPTEPPASTATSAPAPKPKTLTAAQRSVAAKTASRFVAAWGNTKGKSSAQWRAAMKPYAAASLLTALKATRPAQVPSQRPHGAPRVNPSSIPGELASVQVPTTKGGMGVGIKPGPKGKGMVATSIEPVATGPTKPTHSSTSPSATHHSSKASTKPAPKKTAKKSSPKRSPKKKK